MSVAPEIVKRLPIKQLTKDIINRLSGNQCACPTCNTSLITIDGKVTAGQFCHIRGALEGSARFDSEMSNEDRRHIDNIILLCGSCHDMIDKKESRSEYPVSLLKDWKENHEFKIKHSIISNPDTFRAAVDAIINANFDDIIESELATTSSFDIAEKLKYNEVKRNKYLIEDHKVYTVKLSELYSELESQSVFKKEKIFQRIGTLYSRAKGKYAEGTENVIVKVRQHADDIIDDVIEELSVRIGFDNSKNIDLHFAIILIVTDAFMRCKILEEPIKNA